MEISGISTAISSSSQFSTAARVERPTLDDGKSVDESRSDVRGRGKGRRGLALGVFRQELRMALKAHFKMKFAASQQGYAGMQNPATSDEVADEALGAAKQLVSESPVTAAKSLISFRAKVQETASYVRETVTAPNDVEDIDNVVAKVDEGLDGLEAEVANTRESSASVLAVDTRSRQRSTIRIRTQEGDVVKLMLRRVDNLSASDVAISNDSGSMTSTEVSVSSRSRMMLKVQGDLNESELAAIKNVFAKAEQIADEFFGGDIGAAFNSAQGFEFDTEQLARVNMRFKMRQVSNVAYAESLRPAALKPAEEPAVTSSDSVQRPVPEGQRVDDAPVATTAPPVAAPAEPAAPLEPVTPEPAPAAALDVSSALASFFDALSAFLQSVGEGFEAGQGSASFSYQYSESFKLDLLKAVFNTVAPEASADAAAKAETLIDGVSAADRGSDEDQLSA